MSNKQIYSLLAGLMGGLAAKKYMKDSGGEDFLPSGSMAKKKKQRKRPFVGPQEQKGFRPSVSDKFNEELWNSQMGDVSSIFDWETSLRCLYKEALLYCLLIEEKAFMSGVGLESNPDFADYLDNTFIPYISLKIKELELIELYLNPALKDADIEVDYYFLDTRAYLSKVQRISNRIKSGMESYNSKEERLELLNEFYEKYALSFRPGLLVGTASIGFSSALRLGYTADKCGYNFFSGLERELNKFTDTMRDLGLSLTDNSVYNLSMLYNFTKVESLDVGACFLYSVSFLSIYFRDMAKNISNPIFSMLDLMTSDPTKSKSTPENHIIRIISSKEFNKKSGHLLNTSLEVGPVVKSTGISSLTKIYSSLPGADRDLSGKRSKERSLYSISGELKRRGLLNASGLNTREGLKMSYKVAQRLENLTQGTVYRSPSLILRESRYPDFSHTRSSFFEEFDSIENSNYKSMLLCDDICFFDEPVPIESVSPVGEGYGAVRKNISLLVEKLRDSIGFGVDHIEMQKKINRVVALSKLYFDFDPTIHSIYRLSNAGQKVVITNDDHFLFNSETKNMRIEDAKGLLLNLPATIDALKINEVARAKISLIGYHLEVSCGSANTSKKRTDYEKLSIKFIIKISHPETNGEVQEDIVFFPISQLVIDGAVGKFLSMESITAGTSGFPSLVAAYSDITGGGEALGGSGILPAFRRSMSERDEFLRDNFFDFNPDSSGVLPGLPQIGFVLGSFTQYLIQSLPIKHFFSDSCYYPGSEYDKKIGPARDARLLRQEQSRQRQADLQAERQRQRQADLQAERQRQRQADLQAERQRQRQANLQAQAQAERQRQRQANLQADLQAERQRQRQANLKAEAQAERQRQRQANLRAQRQRQRQSEAQRLASQQRRGKQLRPWMKGYPGLDYSRLIRLHSDKMSAQQKYHYENEKFEAVFEARTPLENRRFILPEHYSPPAPYASSYECLKRTIGIIQTEMNPSEPWQWRVLCSMKELCSNLMMIDLKDPDATDPRRVIRPWSNYHRIYNISKFSNDIMDSAYSHSHVISDFNCFWPTTLNSSIYLDLEIMGSPEKIAYMCGESITGYPPGEVSVKSVGKTKLLQIFIGTIGSEQYIDFLVFCEGIHFESSGQNFSIENYCFTYRMYVSGDFGHGEWIDQSPFDDSSIQQELGALWISLVAIFRNRKPGSHFIRIPMLNQQGKYDLDDEDLEARKRRIAAEERARLERRVNAAKKRGIPDMFSSNSEMTLTNDKTGVFDPLQVYVPSNAVKNYSGDSIGPTWSPPKMSARYVKQQNIFGDDLSRETAVVVQDEESALSHIEQVNFQSMKLKDFPYLLNWPKNDEGGRNPHEDSRIFLLQSSIDQAIIDEDRFIWSKVDSSRPRRYYRVPKEVEGWILTEDGTIERFTYPYLLITDIT
jgi:hypothetical protein